MTSGKRTVLQALVLFTTIGFVALRQQSSSQWDFLVYTQQWPAAACVDINDTNHHVCVLTKNVKSWTVHGIWPSRFDGNDPFYCNDSNHFRESEIADIEPELDCRWPNLIKGTGHTSFWKHEWTKHGTCATALPALDSEHKYFKTGLALNFKFNYEEMLRSKNIVPCPKTRYKLVDIRNAIQSFTRTLINIQCILGEDKQEQAIIQVEVCIDIDFNPINCTTKYKAKRVIPSRDDIPYYPQFEECKMSLPILYLPLNYTVY